ncbi:DUF1854 domain-containing protein [Variovorax dokdonensis]|uniref:DUF1854 domain-containing protein n=1 Tax=Variovorax dokdonensis TaxID=344883 RepID=A0ABT7NBR0_9BURK|nr:DUF1854 domain-containing protein [Variovorax dokdonensis]MDM0045325.1 DUF1854 domain-containing protein [Variovorax dokdonensis]
MTHIDIERDPFGRLLLKSVEGRAEVVQPVRAFPLSAADEGVSLVGEDGRERAWIDTLHDLAEPVRQLLREALAVRDFAPCLQRLHSVSSFGVPSTWTVSTDRGETRFVLKAEEDIRRLEGGALLIASGDGVQFRVPDPGALDRHSRKLLERFL